MLRADIAQRARDLLHEICKANDVDMIKGYVSPGSSTYIRFGTSAHLSEPVGKVHQGEYLPMVNSRLMMNFSRLAADVKATGFSR